MDRQVMIKKISRGKFTVVRAKIFSFFNNFLSKKKKINSPMNTFIGAGAIPAKNGMSTIDQ
jgi:hypothetical protein